jgi:hypothetical protein
MRRMYDECTTKYIRNIVNYSPLAKEISKHIRKHQAQDYYNGTRSHHAFSIKAERLG